jgi:hypothetical protein
MGFPVMDSRFIHAELLCDLRLEQTEVESALTEMVTDGGQPLGICRR